MEELGAYLRDSTLLPVESSHEPPPVVAGPLSHPSLGLRHQPPSSSPRRPLHMGRRIPYTVRWLYSIPMLTSLLEVGLRFFTYFSCVPKIPEPWRYIYMVLVPEKSHLIRPAVGGS